MRLLIAFIQRVNDEVFSTRVLIRRGGYEYCPESVERFEQLCPTLVVLWQEIVEKLRVLLDKLEEKPSDY